MVYPSLAMVGVMLCVECVQCGVPAENQPFNEGADEVTVRGNVTDVLPAMDQHQPAAVPIEARTPSWLLPLGLGGNNELVGRRAVQKPTRHKNERNARTARWRNPDGDGPTGWRGENGPARLPFRRSGNWSMTMSMCVFCCRTGLHFLRMM